MCVKCLHLFTILIEESEKQSGVRQTYAQTRIRTKEADTTAQTGIRTRKADTNVLSVTFDNLGSLADVHTGDMLRCKNIQCTATLSHISKVCEEAGSEKKVWQ